MQKKRCVSITSELSSTLHAGGREWEGQISFYVNVFI
jgi:hypothetical protein